MTSISSSSLARHHSLSPFVVLVLWSLLSLLSFVSFLSHLSHLSHLSLLSLFSLFSVLLLRARVTNTTSHHFPTNLRVRHYTLVVPLSLGLLLLESTLLLHDLSCQLSVLFNDKLLHGTVK